MVRNILILIVLCICVYAGWLIYKGHEEKAKLDSGDVTCTGCLEGDAKANYLKENSGETADGNSEHKTASARVAAEEAANGSLPTTAPTSATPSTTSTYSSTTSSMQAPSASTAPVTIPTVGQPTNPYAGTTATTTTPYAAPYQPGLPVADSVSPNPSNGMKFAGSGSYQWYRQGNLTWRVDTTTGRSCIIYATMEEWRKQIVMSHGCGRNA